MKPKAIWTECRGEAHLPEVGGNIDNCLCCAPWWFNIPTCAKGHMLRVSRGKTSGIHVVGVRRDTNAYCRECRTYYDLTK